jgi:hypothetical protein
LYLRPINIPRPTAVRPNTRRCSADMFDHIRAD